METNELLSRLCSILSLCFKLWWSRNSTLNCHVSLMSFVLFFFLLCKWPFKYDSLQLSSLGDFTPTRVSFSVLCQETLANTPQCRHPVGHLSFVASAANLSGQKQCLDLNVWEIHILILRPLCGWQLVESVWNRKKLGGNVGGKFFFYFLGDSIVMPVSTCPS